MPTDMITGVANYMGWRKKRGKDRFIVEIELTEAPTWPIDVVWKRTPITLCVEVPTVTPQQQDNER